MTISSVVSMPDVNQLWAHSTVSQELLRKVLDDERVTAIETDILIGSISDSMGSGAGDALVPICAHPPDNASDLSVQSLIQQLAKTAHHLKLDFKEAECVAPSLSMVNEILATPGTKAANMLLPPNQKRALFVNADIVPGPGRSDSDMTVTARQFLEDCQNAFPTNGSIQGPPQFDVIYSLGWKVDVCWPFGYSSQHVAEMNRVLIEHQAAHLPLVLAVNARLLAKSSATQDFLNFLKSNPNRQILAWTGSGEPPIGQYTKSRIERLYQSVNGQVGFDAQVAENWSHAMAYDFVMYVLGWKNLLLRLARQIWESLAKSFRHSSNSTKND